MAGPAAADGLLVPTGSRLHRLPAHPKLLAVPAFVVCVVSIPVRSWQALTGCAVLLGVAVGVARLPLPTVGRRMLVETPFVVFALLLPFVATGPRVEVAGLSLSRGGLEGAANLLAKATLGVVAGVLLAATTTPRDLLAGLERLRCPPAFVQVTAFLLRYLSVVGDDLRRMRIARESRGGASGTPAQLRAVAAGVGVLFVRSYERGERVHQAMLARGWTGRTALLPGRPATAGDWVTAAALPLPAAVLAVLARTAS